jgi:hypothetical protein
MLKIDGGAHSKITRTEDGSKRSSLSSLMGKELWKAVCKLSIEALCKEKENDLQTVIKSLSTYSIGTSTSKVDKIVEKIAPVVESNPALKNLFSELVKNAVGSDPFISDRLNALVNRLYISNRELAEIIASRGEGFNYICFERAIKSKDEDFFNLLLETLDFSFLSNPIQLLKLTENNLSTRCLNNLIKKLQFDTATFEKILDSDLSYSVAYSICEIALKYNPISSEDIQHLFDLAKIKRLHAWMGYWASKGGVITHRIGSEVAFPATTHLPTTDSMLRLLSTDYSCAKGSVNLKNIPPNLTEYSGSQLRENKKVNPVIFYFLTAKRTATVWGFNSVLKMPHLDFDYCAGSYVDISRLYWVQTLRTFENIYPWVQKTISALLNIKNVPPITKPLELLDSYVNLLSSNQPELIASGCLDHVKIYVHYTPVIIDCNRGLGNISPGMSIYQIPPLDLSLYTEIVMARGFEHNIGVTQQKIEQRGLFTNPTVVSMQPQMAPKDNCSITSLDAAIYALTIFLSGAETMDESKAIYKVLSAELRYHAAIDLFKDIDLYLKETPDLELDRYYYSLLAGIYLKLEFNSTKLISDKITQAVFNQTVYLMNVLEERFK